MTFRFSLLVAVAALATPGAVAQSLPSDTIAFVGNTPLLARDLIERLELMPFPGKDRPHLLDTTRSRALYALIAEKLLALEARRLGIAEDETTRRMRKGLESIIVRDAFYRKEVGENIAISASERREGMSRMQKQLTVLALTGASESAVRNALPAFGVRPDSVPPLGASSAVEVDTLTVNFGSAEQELEEAAYALRPDAWSKPIRSRTIGWTSLRLLAVEPNPALAGLGPQEQTRRLDKLIRARKESERMREVFYRTLGRKQARAQEEVFVLLTSAISELWAEYSDQAKRSGSYVLLPELVDKLAERLEPHLDRALVAMEGEDLTLGEVLEEFRYRPFAARDIRGAEMEHVVNDAVRMAAGNAYLSREGRTLALHQSASVTADMRRWTDFWAARSLLYAVRDTVRVSHEDVARFMIAYAPVFRGRFEVSVVELLANARDEAVAHLEAVAAGRSLTELAARFTQRQAWAARGGRSGWFPPEDVPEIGFRALAADSGAIVGPVAVTGGFSVFSVEGKRSRGIDSPDTLVQRLTSRLTSERRQAVLDAYIARLARANGLQVYTDRVDAVPVQPVQMFTRRFIGFGGTMTASPMLLYQWGWADEFLKPPEQLP